MKIIFDEQVTFVTDPVSPCAGQDFTVSWQEKNIGGEDSSEYQDIFDLDDQGSGDSKELRCDPLPVGEAAMRSLTFTLPAGDYVMTLVINGQAPLTLGNVIIRNASDCGPTTQRDSRAAMAQQLDFVEDGMPASGPGILPAFEIVAVLVGIEKSWWLKEDQDEDAA